MRISDWSSDVCSSDLHGALLRGPAAPDAVRLSQGGRRLPGRVGGHGAGAVDAARSARGDADGSAQEPQGRDRRTARSPDAGADPEPEPPLRSEEHTSELQSLMRI